MNILVTGGSGFLGSVLVQKLEAQGHNVWSVSRHESSVHNLPGDIQKQGLGITMMPDIQFDRCYHLAAILRPGPDKDGSIIHTNVGGTINVIQFCKQHHIPHLLFCSTAYTNGRNPYERSKRMAETIVNDSGIPKITIFKPAIIMGMPEGHFSLFVSLLVKVHKRAELVRRGIEGALRLPVIQPVFRLKGNPEGQLNLVTVDAVAEAMATKDGAETYWLTNPAPPTLRDVCQWTGEFIMVQLLIEPEFQATPLEAGFHRLTKAFEPYLQGDQFPSDLGPCPIGKEFIGEQVRKLFS